MKRFLTYFLFSVALIVGLCGCKSQPTQTPTAEPVAHKNISIETIVNDVTAEIGINFPVPIDDEAVDQLILAAFTEETPPITREDIEEYYGVMCTSNLSSDFILGMKTHPDKQKYAESVLSTVKTNRMRCFEGYLDEEYQKANNSIVLTVDNYTFLAILGNPSNGAEENARKIENMILSYFD